MQAVEGKIFAPQCIIKIYICISSILGLWGLVAAGLFKADGLLRSGNVNMLIWNVIGGACIIVWHAICSAVLFITLKKLGLFRIPSKLEKSGLDEIYHREPAYRFDSRRGDFI